MLHGYRFSNFQSFARDTEVDLSLGGKVPQRGWEFISPSGKRLTSALAVFGANAAGKTALLKPIAFVDWFISNSFSFPAEGGIPIVLHFESSSDPFEIEFVAEDDDGDVWRYELRATPERVLFEGLYKKRKRFNYVFERNWDPERRRYAIKQQGFGLPKKEAEKVRPNASLISTAVQYDVGLAKHFSQVLNVTTNIDYFGRIRISSDDLSAASEFYSEFPTLQNAMIKILKEWDLGLSGIKFEQVEVLGPDGKAAQRLQPFGLHKGASGDEYKLAMALESSGTQSAFLLLRTLLTALAIGGIAVIDEMESDLHPSLVESIVNIFADSDANPHNAQLLFTCHSVGVLNLLQKSQVMFVQKDECVSEAYRGDQIEGLRSDDNLRSKYETGALGAVPRLE